MKFFTNKKVTQKIIIALVTVIVLNFSVPIQSNAFEWTEVAGDLLQEIVLLVDAIGDVVMGALNKFMLGTDKIYGSAMLDNDDSNLTDKRSSLYAQDGPTEQDVVAEIPANFEPDGLFMFDWKVPNFLYCPENIFANKIAALDVNFINKHVYTAVEYEEDSNGTLVVTPESGKKAESSAGGTLRNVIASWYKAFRNIAIVGLLIVLVYLGIRIMISSTAVDKAKYKQNLYDWLVALCLVVVIHFIMAGIMMFTDSFTNLLSDSVNKTIYIEADGVKFRTNLTGYVRFMAQSPDFSECTTYTIIYIVLVIYTCMFTFTYFKRFLYMAFFTMIAPLVAMTYPIDKIKDGKAQAFNLWFKEYTMNAIIQPVHLLLYTVFVGSAMDLAMNNPIYAIVAIGFLTPAEKFIKKMFGVESQTTAGGLGELAGGALTMQGIKQIAGAFKANNKKQDGKNPESGTGNNVLKKRGATGDFPDPVKIIGSSQLDEAQEGNTGDSDDDGAKPYQLSRRRLKEPQKIENWEEKVEEPKIEGQEIETQQPETQQPETQQPETQQPETQQSETQQPEKQQPKTQQPKTQQLIKQRQKIKKPKTQQERRQVITAQRARRKDIRDQQVKIQKPKAQQTKTPSTPYINKDLINKTIKQPEKKLEKKSEKKSGTILEAKEKTRKTGFRAGVSAVAGSAAIGVKRKIRNAVKPISTKQDRRDTIYKVAKGGVKSLARAGGVVAKAGAVAAGGVLLGTAGLAAGVASGDFSKALSYGFGAASMGAGIAASRVGNGKKTGDKLASGLDNMQQIYEAGAYSKEDLKRQKQEQYDREWKNKKENYQYLMQEKNMSAKEAEEFLNDDTTQQFLNAGITDTKLIYNARKKLIDDKKKNYSVQRAIASAKLAKTVPDDFEKNHTLRKSFKDNIMSEDPKNITGAMANKLEKEIIDLKKD